MPTETIAPPAAPAPSIDGVKAERTRNSEINALGVRFKKTKEAAAAIDAGTSVADFRSALLDGISVEVNEQPTVTVSTTANRGGNAANSQSIGSLFVASDAYRNHVKGTGQRSNAFEIPNVSLRTTLDTTGITSINKLGGVPGLLDQQPLRIANIIAGGSTNSTTIRYIQEDSFTNSAAAIAEGADKGASALAVSEVDAAVRKVATYLKVTDEMLSDHEQMKSFVDNRLAYMVNAKVDYYLLNGTGQGTALVGSFGMGAQWFQKLGLTVETTNTDQDDFVKNLVTVRAEMRLALACYKPKAFCTITGIPA